MQECWRRRYASFLHLKLNEVADLHPSFMEHEVLARRELVVGSLICGTNLALCTRSSANLFHHSPNVVQTLPMIPYVSARSLIVGKYLWNLGDLEWKDWFSPPYSLPTEPSVIQSIPA